MLLAIVGSGCGDDDVVGDGGIDAPIDGAMGAEDSGMDGAVVVTDGGGGFDAAPVDGEVVDASLDGGGADGGMDAGVDGGVADGGMDAGACGSGPACAVGEVCWGTGCSCIEAISGDTYLRTDGTVVLVSGTLMRVIETAPGTALDGVVEIMDGMRHGCAVRDDGTVWCWAKTTTGNVAGELGNGTTGGATVVAQASQVLVSAGTPLTGMAHLANRSTSRCYLEATTCAIRGSDGAVFCWGADANGVGSGLPVSSFYTEDVYGDRPYATQILASAGVGLTGVAQVELGARHACARTTAGAVLCWGANVTGPLGQGDQMTRRFPTAVTLPASADEIGVGFDFTCARIGGEVYCWGASGLGQIGFGDPTTPAHHDGCINYCHLMPAQVLDMSMSALGGAVDLDVAYQGACVRLADDSLTCWGNGVGQLATPLLVGGSALVDVAQMTTCSSSTLGASIRYLRTDGTLHRTTLMLTPMCGP